MKKLTTILLIVLFIQAIGQHDQKYYPVDNPVVQQKIEQWQDLKFGLLMHWGAYSQWGIVESWSICAEDEGWCRRSNDNYTEYKKDYFNLIKTFNPEKFSPDKWAKAAKDAGMKYVVFTTKHHDGFCMFDSKFSNYKVTSEECPFHTNPKSNIAKEVFDAFRDEGLWAGAYFSKPDWHSEYYWWPNFATPDRNVNYDVTKYPERWENFVQYTHNQILELVLDYGPLDILWLDGGWVQKTSDEEITRWINRPGYKFIHYQNQDIRMDELVRKVRAIKEDIIVVDRAVEGPNQNYLTPENRVPEKLLPYPWESCIISGGSWSWIENPNYMKVHDAVQLLVDIVAKGGNLLLNVAPGPDGTWDSEAYELLEGMGEWMKVNAEAIYNSVPYEPYKAGNICFTSSKDGVVYIHYLADKEENLPERIIVPQIKFKNAKISLLGTKDLLGWEDAGNGIVIRIPDKMVSNYTGKYVYVFKVIE